MGMREGENERKGRSAKETETQTSEPRKELLSGTFREKGQA